MKQCKNLTSRPVSKAATNVIYLYKIYIYIIYIQHIYIQYIYTICIYIHIYIYTTMEKVSRQKTVISQLQLKQNKLNLKPYQKKIMQELITMQIGKFVRAINEKRKERHYQKKVAHQDFWLMGCSQYYR